MLASASYQNLNPERSLCRDFIHCLIAPLSGRIAIDNTSLSLFTHFGALEYIIRNLHHFVIYDTHVFLVDDSITSSI